MRNVFKEYRQCLISWDEAFFIANNNAATSSMDTEYWAEQMENFAIDMADHVMSSLGYKQDGEGNYFKPITTMTHYCWPGK